MIVSIAAPAGPTRNFSSRKKLFLMLRLRLVMSVGVVVVVDLRKLLLDVSMMLRVQKRRGRDIECYFEVELSFISLMM